jgi:hypothetical protein
MQRHSVKLFSTAPTAQTRSRRFVRRAQAIYAARYVILGIGVVLLVCVVLYVIPITSILGAILLTGYLGGAIATHVRVGNPLFSHTLFPVYIAVLV